jgi:hypothetical protein
MSETTARLGSVVMNVMVKNERTDEIVFVSVRGSRTDVRTKDLLDAIAVHPSFNAAASSQAQASQNFQLFSPDRRTALTDPTQNIIGTVYSIHQQHPLIYGRKTTTCGRVTRVAAVCTVAIFAVYVSYWQWTANRRNSWQLVYF